MRTRIRTAAPTLALLLATALAALPAAAFDIGTRSDNQLISEDAMKQRVQEIAAEVGHRIPDDPRIRVSVYSRALESQFEGAMIYLHRIQLTKAFQSTPPYPFAGYLPLRTTSRYGVDNEAGMREKFDETLRAFFETLKSVDPDGEDAPPENPREGAALSPPPAETPAAAPAAEADAGSGEAPAGPAPAGEPAAPGDAPASDPAGLSPPPPRPPVVAEAGAEAPGETPAPAADEAPAAASPTPAATASADPAAAAPRSDGDQDAVYVPKAASAAAEPAALPNAATAADASGFEPDRGDAPPAVDPALVAPPLPGDAAAAAATARAD